MAALNSMAITVPDERVLQTFSSMLKPIFEQKDKLFNEIQHLTKLRDELLPLLMNGQVTLNSCLFNHGFLFFIKFTIWEVKEYVTWMLKCRYYKVFNYNFVNLWTMNR